MSCGVRQPEELTLFLIQLRRHRAKMAATRQQTLAHLQRLHGHKESLTTSSKPCSSPPLDSAPSPVSCLRPPFPLGSFNSQVGALQHAPVPVRPQAGYGCHSVYGKVKVQTVTHSDLCTYLYAAEPMVKNLKGALSAHLWHFENSFFNPFCEVSQLQPDVQ